MAPTAGQKADRNATPGKGNTVPQNSDGQSVEVETGQRKSNRGRKPGTQTAEKTLTAATQVRSFTAADLGIDTADAMNMARKQTAGGRTPDERSEAQQQVDYDVYQAYQEYLASDFAKGPDTPGNRLVRFLPVTDVPAIDNWPERIVTHDDGSTSTVKEWRPIKEAGQMLGQSRDYLRRQGYKINVHVFAPRPHTDGSTWLIPWSVATRPERQTAEPQD